MRFILRLAGHLHHIALAGTAPRRLLLDESAFRVEMHTVPGTLTGAWGEGEGEGEGEVTPQPDPPSSVLAASVFGGGPGLAHVYVDGGFAGSVFVAGSDDRRFVWLDGDIYDITILEPLAVHARSASAAGGLEARAPMPGTTLAIHVAPGDAVKAGDILVVIESMKLEVSIKAPQDGQVAAIHCAAGSGFDKDAVLVTLAAPVVT